MLSAPSETCEKVYDVVRQIPTGKVATYGDIAKLAGISNPRVVGNCLHHNPYPISVPCHRVVNATGRLAPAFAFGGPDKQRELLEQDGVKFRRDLVALTASRWNNKLKKKGNT